MPICFIDDLLFNLNMVCLLKEKSRMGEKNSMEKLQFLYKLKLIPSLLDEDNWTDEENQIVQSHFETLQKLHQEGKVLLAGRTQNNDSTMFGIVILEVTSEEEALEIMYKDPAVKGGVMSATLFPYKIAIPME